MLIGSWAVRARCAGTTAPDGDVRPAGARGCGRAGLVLTGLVAGAVCVLAGCGPGEAPGSVTGQRVLDGGAAPPPAASAADVVHLLRESGVPIAGVVVFDRDDDPNRLLGRPGGYLSKAAFTDLRLVDGRGRYAPGEAPYEPRQVISEPSTGTGPAGARPLGPVDLGGSVEVFADPPTAARRRDRIRALLAADPNAPGEVDLLHGPVLVRLSRALTAGQVRGYAGALTLGLTGSGGIVR